MRDHLESSRDISGFLLSHAVDFRLSGFVHDVPITRCNQNPSSAEAEALSSGRCTKKQQAFF